jgi:hypothetical protein
MDYETKIALRQEEIKENFRHKIYQTLSELVMESPEIGEEATEELIDQSVEWWKTHFYEEN